MLNYRFLLYVAMIAEHVDQHTFDVKFHQCDALWVLLIKM